MLVQVAGRWPACAGVGTCASGMGVSANMASCLRTAHACREGWYTGLSGAFLGVRVPKVLLLAGTDRLDRELTIGQMQGRFQMVLLPQVGALVHCLIRVYCLITSSQSLTHVLQQHLPSSQALLMQHAWGNASLGVLVMQRDDG